MTEVGETQRCIEIVTFLARVQHCWWELNWMALWVEGHHVSRQRVMYICTLMTCTIMYMHDSRNTHKKAFNKIHNKRHLVKLGKSKWKSRSWLTGKIKHDYPSTCVPVLSLRHPPHTKGYGKFAYYHNKLAVWPNLKHQFSNDCWSTQLLELKLQYIRTNRKN